VDKIGLFLFIGFIVLYFITRRRFPVFAWLSGVGAGIFIGALWAMYIVMSTIP
jgi:hypothetical protein